MWIWIVIGVAVLVLGILFVGKYFFAMIALEFIAIVALHHFKPEWFEK